MLLNQYLVPNRALEIGVTLRNILVKEVIVSLYKIIFHKVTAMS